MLLNQDLYPEEGPEARGKLGKALPNILNWDSTFLSREELCEFSLFSIRHPLSSLFMGEFCGIIPKGACIQFLP